MSRHLTLASGQIELAWRHRSCNFSGPVHFDFLPSRWNRYVLSRLGNCFQQFAFSNSDLRGSASVPSAYFPAVVIFERPDGLDTRPQIALEHCQLVDLSLSP